MLKMNKQVLKEKRDELTQFKGWLPFRLWRFIDITERFEYLESVGLYDEVQKLNAKYKYKLMNSPNDEILMDELVLKFVNENPQFKDILES